MRIVGPYSDDNWDWLPRANELCNGKRTGTSLRKPLPGLRAFALAFVVPLIGAGIAGFVYKALGKW